MGPIPCFGSGRIGANESERRKEPAIAWFLTGGAEPKLEGMGPIPCFGSRGR